ncbi:aminotransferase class III-fold pyridoxal phosphate-dependent enzyme [Streptomyces tauricus]|uniref:aminotransferase class III-fold pyridoxal phosphate-dependent enzyme n=1 Tax=Streptomyces tauricus TaxID=68274 RepID=UPI0033CD6E09
MSGCTTEWYSRLWPAISSQPVARGELNARAAAALAGLAPDPLSKVMLLNSGAEAVEAALKLARARTGRTGLAHLAGSFHGKTTGALSLTDAAPFRDGLGPLLPGVLRLPRDDAAFAARLIRERRPAAVFAEPVQGEGGVHPLTPDHAQALRRACDEAGTLLVLDEIQCGLGRCGTLWAHETLGVRPDILLSGKALGGGVIPVSAMVATEDAYRPYDHDPLLHTSTFGGNPLASAALLATAEVVTTRDVPALARRAGQRLHTVLTGLVRDWPGLFTGVTGRGLILGLHGTRPDVSAEMMRAALSGRILLTMCLTAPAVRGRIGLAAQDVAVYPTHTVEENLRFFGALAGLRRAELRVCVDTLIETLDLTPLRRRRARELSGGQRRRLHVGCALVHRPRLILLDEPTAGADPQTRRGLLRQVRSLADEGSTVLYTTHYLQEVEELDSRVVVLGDGRVREDAGVDQLIARYTRSELVLRFTGHAPRLPWPGARVAGDTVYLPTARPGVDLVKAVELTGEDRERLRTVELSRAGLEAAYLRLIGAGRDE